MDILGKLPSLKSVALPIKLLYSYIKVEKTLSKVSPVALAQFCYLAPFSKSVWSVHSLIKLSKFGKKFEKLKPWDKNNNWKQTVIWSLDTFSYCLKTIASIFDVLQYNLIFIAAYRALGIPAPFSEPFLDELGKVPFLLAPFKIYRKSIAYQKAEKRWNEEKKPEKLASRKWNYIQMSLLYGAASLCFIYWTATVARKVFPTLPDPAPYDRCLDLAFYSLKFGAILAKTYSVHLK